MKKAKTRIIAIIMAGLMVASVGTAVAIAPNAMTVSAVAEQKCGDSITWSISADGTLNITGTGRMYDYSNFSGSPAPWKSSSSSIKSIVISEGVTRIGNDAFYGLSTATKVVMPSTLKEIAPYAFQSCSKLADITMPSSLTSIGMNAFMNTAFYKNNNNWQDNMLVLNGNLIKANYIFIEGDVTIPDGVRLIADSAFNMCSDITSVKIPSSVKIIGNNAFFACTGIKSVDIPSTVSRIGESAFAQCKSLESFQIPTSINSVPREMFIMCYSLKSIVIPSNISTIEPGAFKQCTSLASVTIPTSVTWVGKSAFSITNDEGSSAPVRENPIKDVYYLGEQSEWNHFKSSCVDTGNEDLILNVPNYHFHSHSYGTTWYSNKASHWQRCSCGKTGNFSNHSYTAKITKQPTYTETGERVLTCKCGNSYKEAMAKKTMPRVTVSSIANVSNGISITWNKVAGVQGYRIYRHVSGKPYTLIATVQGDSVTSYTDTGVQNSNGVECTYAVRAYSGNIMSSYTQGAYYRLTAPEITGIASRGNSSLTVKWSRNTRANGYYISYKLGNKSAGIYVAGNANIYRNIYNLQKGKSCSVNVRAYKKVNGKTYYSAWSSPRSVTIK